MCLILISFIKIMIILPSLFCSGQRECNRFHQLGYFLLDHRNLDQSKTCVSFYQSAKEADFENGWYKTMNVSPSTLS